jgi:hypothetical protein
MLRNQEEVLTMFEVEDIRKFEEKFRVTTGEFLLSAELRASLPEDDVFQWEAFEAHREELVRVGEELRGVYLSSLAKDHEAISDMPTAEKQCLLAA